MVEIIASSSSSPDALQGGSVVVEFDRVDGIGLVGCVVRVSASLSVSRLAVTGTAACNEQVESCPTDDGASLSTVVGSLVFGGPDGRGDFSLASSPSRSGAVLFRVRFTWPDVAESSVRGSRDSDWDVFGGGWAKVLDGRFAGVLDEAPTE